jgi:hypothetical protein
MNEILRRHEELKKRIHNFRIPLSVTGQRIMSLVYMSIPVIAGYFVMQYTIKISERNIGLQGSKLSDKYSHDDNKAKSRAFQNIILKIKDQK